MSVGSDIVVEVVMAWPRRHRSAMLKLPRGSTVADAVALAAFDDTQEVTGFAVYGSSVTLATLLADGDRLELLRPLQLDPKESRRRRAERKPNG